MPTLSPLCLLSALLPKPTGNAAEAATDGEFAALLGEITQQTAVAASPGGAAPQPEAAGPVTLPGQSAPPGLPAAPSLAAPAEAAPLPETGKALPVPLPEPAIAAETTGRDGPASPRKDKPGPLKALEITLPDAASEPAAPQVQEPAAVAVVLHGSAAIIPPAIPAPAPPLAARTESPGAPAPEPESQVAPPSQQPALVRAVPVRSGRLAQAAPRPIAERAAGIDPPLQTSTQLPVSPAPANEPAPPAVTAPLRQLIASLARDERRGQTPLASPEAAAALPQIAMPAAPVPMAGGEAAPLRPHDFSALIDRLAAAREAVQPQMVSMALPHSEFGPIALRFHRDETGLVVSMASRDPAFAPAAAQALAPTAQAVPGDGGAASGQGGANDRGHPAGEQSPQARQQHREPRDPREAQRQTGQTASRTEPDERPRRPGIFA